MRLVRFPRRTTLVSEDIRAALASLGRGRNLVGGLALVGTQPPGLAQAVDAVLIVPHGVLVVVGVDLPDPAMRLEAPLDGQWKADGWPLVRTDNAVNPGTEPLALAAAVAELIRATAPEATVGTVIAVGPFVETVEQPPADLAGPVRVVYPTSTSMLAATVSLASAERVFTAEQVRALVRALEPDAPEQDDEVLAAEGFTEDHPLASAPPTVPMIHPATPPPPAVPVRPPAPSPHPRPPAPPARPASPMPTPSPARRRTRWQPLAGAAVLVLLIAATIAILLAQADSEPAPRAAPPPAPAVVRAGGIEFTEQATGSTVDCAQHAVGDLQVRLDDGGCAALRRGSFVTTVDGRPVAVSVAALTFADEAQAAAFQELADTPGTGVITDVATDTGRWPDASPSFADAAYTSSLDGITVRLVLACPLAGPSPVDDPALTEVAEAAQAIPLAP
ncbi:hypothetical protein ABZ863_06815 [Saccharomonospora sp. NPDC046836]|uniref:hypothetical protein n=1 Tax=Saccharomonospora sp. NPDC046836 TaxID=3156921 RepID=UPI0033CBDDFF